MKKHYGDSRNSRDTMSRLRNDLRDVQNIMVTNIEDVMSRGETLDGCKLIQSLFGFVLFHIIDSI